MVNSISTTAKSMQLNVLNNQTAKSEQQPITDTAPITAELEQGTPQAAPVAEETELSAEKAKSVIDSMNEVLNTTSTKLRYQYHDKLDKYYVTLVDSETDEIVREIPNKKLMDIYAAMLDFVGVLIDEKI